MLNETCPHLLAKETEARRLNKLNRVHSKVNSKDSN